MDEIKQIPKLRPTTVTRDHTCITQRPPINFISFPLNIFLLTTQNGHLYKWFLENQDSPLHPQLRCTENNPQLPHTPWFISHTTWLNPWRPQTSPTTPTTTSVGWICTATADLYKTHHNPPDSNNWATQANHRGGRWSSKGLRGLDERRGRAETWDRWTHHSENLAWMTERAQWHGHATSAITICAQCARWDEWSQHIYRVAWIQWAWQWRHPNGIWSQLHNQTACTRALCSRSYKRKLSRRGGRGNGFYSTGWAHAH